MMKVSYLFFFHASGFSDSVKSVVLGNGNCKEKIVSHLDFSKFLLRLFYKKCLLPQYLIKSIIRRYQIDRQKMKFWIPMMFEKSFINSFSNNNKK